MDVGLEDRRRERRGRVGLAIQCKRSAHIRTTIVDFKSGRVSRELGTRGEGPMGTRTAGTSSTSARPHLSPQSHRTPSLPAARAGVRSFALAFAARWGVGAFALCVRP